MTRIVVSDSGVTRVEIGPLGPEHVSHVQDAVYQAERTKGSGTAAEPPGAGLFPGADVKAAWYNDVQRAIEDQGSTGVAVGVWVGSSGAPNPMPTMPSGYIIGRKRADAPSTIVVLLHASGYGDDLGGPQMVEMARQQAAACGGNLAVREVTVRYNPV